MNNNEVSISTTILGYELDGGINLIKGLEMIKAAGFSMVELNTRQSNIREREAQIRATGLQVLAIHGSLGPGAISLDENIRRVALETEFLRLDDTAVFAPCPYVIHYYDRYNDSKYGQQFRKSIEDLYARSSPLGFNLAIETVPYKPMHNERHPDSKEISDFVRSFAKPDINMTIDVNHSNLNENLMQVCENCRDIIAHVHISDNRGEWDDHLSPGEGVINFPELFTALRANGYKGPWNLEVRSALEDLSIEWLAELRISVENMVSDLNK